MAAQQVPGSKVPNGEPSGSAQQETAEEKRQRDALIGKEFMRYVNDVTDENIRKIIKDLFFMSRGCKTNLLTRPPLQLLRLQRWMCTELLHYGYHRARVQNLSLHDRIIGGIIWGYLTMVSTSPGDKPYQFTFKEAPPNVEKNVERRIRDCQEIIAALEEIKAPFKMDVRQVVCLSGCTTYMVNWVMNNFYHTTNGPQEPYHFCHKLIDEPKYAMENIIPDAKKMFFTPNECHRLQYHNSEKWDYSIVFDTNLTPWQILSDYYNYAKTGKRVYPSIEEATKSNRINFYGFPEELGNHFFPDASVYGELARRNLKEFRNLSAPQQAVFEKMVYWIKKINVAERVCEKQGKLLEQLIRHCYIRYDLDQLDEEFTLVKSAVNKTKIPEKQTIDKLVNDNLTQSKNIYDFFKKDSDDEEDEDNKNHQQNFEEMANDLYRQRICVMKSHNRFNFLLSCPSSSFETPQSTTCKAHSSEVEMLLVYDIHMIDHDIKTARTRFREYKEQDDNVQLDTTLYEMFAAYLADCTLAVMDLKWKAKFVLDGRLDYIEVKKSKVVRNFYEKLRANNRASAVDELARLLLEIQRLKEKSDQLQQYMPVENNCESE